MLANILLVYKVHTFFDRKFTTIFTKGLKRRYKFQAEYGTLVTAGVHIRNVPNIDYNLIITFHNKEVI